MNPAIRGMKVNLTHHEMYFVIAQRHYEFVKANVSTRDRIQNQTDKDRIDVAARWAAAYSLRLEAMVTVIFCALGFGLAHDDPRTIKGHVFDYPSS